MATPKDTDACLTLEISGQSVTPDKFIRGVRAFFGLLKEVTIRICEDQEPVEWNIQVKSGSNLIEVYPQPGYSDQVILKIAENIKTGVETLENRPEEPDQFSRQEIGFIRELGSVAGIDEDDDTTVRVWVYQEPMDVTHRIVAHVAEIAKDGYQDHGSVEGKLQTVSERGGFKFVLYEPVWDESIRCYVNTDMLDDVLKYFGKRVQVFGIIKYRKDGSPISIKVEKVEPFPESEDIPDFRSVRGILRKIQ